MRTTMRITLLASMLLAPAGITPSLAAPMTFYFEAQVDTVIENSVMIPGGTIHAGDIFAGYYTFESTAPDMDPDPNAARYVDTAPTSEMRFVLGGFTFRTNPSNVDCPIIVGNGLTSDIYVYHSNSNLPIAPGLVIHHISMDIYDLTAQAFTSDALPLTPLDLALFSHKTIYVRGDTAPDLSGPTYEIYAHLRTMTDVPPDTDPVPAPEPGTLLLMLTGGLGLAARVRATRRG